MRAELCLGRHAGQLHPQSRALEPAVGTRQVARASLFCSCDCHLFGLVRAAGPLWLAAYIQEYGMPLPVAYLNAP